MADIFDVVADPTRRDVLLLLLASHRASGAASGELSVGQMVERLGLTQPTVSKHLKVLRDHGLVTVREDGQHRYYHLDARPMTELENWVAPFVGDVADGVASADYNPTAVASLHGAEAGEKVGRAIAERSHRVRTVAEDAGAQVNRAIHRLIGR